MNNINKAIERYNELLNHKDRESLDFCIDCKHFIFDFMGTIENSLQIVSKHENTFADKGESNE